MPWSNPPTHEHDDDRRAAVHRVLDHYLHTAMAASQRFNPVRSPLQLADPQPGVVPVDVADKEQAMAWFDAEVPVLLALIAYADANGFDTHAWQIPWTLGPSSTGAAGGGTTSRPSRPRWPRRRRLDDTLRPRARALTCSATRKRRWRLRGGRPERPAGAGHVPRAGRPGQRGRGAQRPRRHAGEAGTLPRGTGRRAGRAADPQGRRALVDAGHLENGVGWLYAHLGQYDQALTHCQRALSLHRESGHRGGTADTLDSLGYIYLHLGDLAQAKTHYEQAIDAYREIGAPFGEGNSLAGLGEATLAAGQLHTAHHIWQQAVTILRDIPSYDTTQLELRLSELETRSAEPANSSGRLG